MCTIKLSVKDENGFNFLVSNLILSKGKEFTYKEILDDVKKYEIDVKVNKDYEVKRTLISLRDSGLIYENASSFSVCL